MTLRHERRKTIQSTFSTSRLHISRGTHYCYETPLTCIKYGLSYLILHVSLEKQGVSGLGLEAQRDAVMRYVAAHGTLLAEYTEVESGKRHKNRPQLLAALEHCKKARATLVIAKLDRLSRNVAFISQLLESDVQFVCCDNPHATKTMLRILAVFAQHEREQTSERTIGGLSRGQGARREAW